ncbi:MAG: hypothetical protein R2746_10360 [Acidimicrobiales bacterium]
MSSSGTAVTTTPTVIVQNPAVFTAGWLSGRPSPLMTTNVVKPTMKNVVHTQGVEHADRQALVYALDDRLDVLVQVDAGVLEGLHRPGKRLPTRSAAMATDVAGDEAAPLG